MALNELERAKDKLALARLEISEINPVFQTLNLQDGQDDIFLLQLNKEILSKLSEGDILTIRGESEDPAVICSKDTTYELKEAETSNSLLLMPNCLILDSNSENTGEIETQLISQNVNGIFHTYFELRSMKPSFKKLHLLLNRSAYQGKEYEDSSSEEKYTFDMLLDVIQSSEEELKKELKQMQACCIDGFIRVLDLDFKFNVLSNILNFIEAQSMPYNKISKEPIIEALEGLENADVIENCFEWFTLDTDVLDDNNFKLYSLREDLICKLYAEILLRSSGRFHLQDFMESWKRSVPEGMTCDLSLLKGIALTDFSDVPVIFHFPVNDLPENIKERFEFLFRVKKKWTYDEIVPYLENQTRPGSDVKSLLIKFTRESTKDGKKIYSSKW